MIVLTTANTITTMSPANPPAARVTPGQQVLFQTLDCFGNHYYLPQAQREDTMPDNPATGPLFVDGAQPGDTLKVTIRRITISPTAMVEQIAGKGCLGSRVDRDAFCMVPLRDGAAHFQDVTIPLRPMVGVIGTAPARPVPTLLPGPHGGNLDCGNITQGAVVYLPVFTPGAQLALGDLHGVMADGEIGYSGFEVYGSVEVQVDLLKGVRLPNPVVREGETLYFLASADTLDQAARQASLDLCDFITHYQGRSVRDTVMLLNAIAHLGVCQAVNGQKTVKLAVHRRFLHSHPLV